MIIQIDRDAVDRSTTGFVRTAGVSRVGEGRGGQSLNARHDDSGTFLRSRAGIRAAERGERLERSNEGLQGFLKEDGLGVVNGGHGEFKLSFRLWRCVSNPD